MCNGPLYIDSLSTFQLLRNYSRIDMPAGSFLIYISFSYSLLQRRKRICVEVIIIDSLGTREHTYSYFFSLVFSQSRHHFKRVMPSPLEFLERVSLTETCSTKFLG